MIRGGGLYICECFLHPYVESYFWLNLYKLSFHVNASANVGAECKFLSLDFVTE